MFKFRRTSVAALAAAAAIPGLLTVAAPPASAAPAPYTIALITSITGLAAPQDVGTVGAFKARLALQNAQGGINGHKLEPLIIDDQTSPTAVSTGIQDAISKGAIGIVSESPVLFLAAKVAAAAGIPVTGDDSDGPEWGEPGYTNMFAAVYGSLNPSYPVNTGYGQLLKATGATKVATYAIGVSPDSVRANSDVAQSFARVGGKTLVNDSSVPFGSVDFTAAALTAKNAGVNALWPNLDSASDVAITVAYEQAGIKTKAVILPAGLSPSLIKSPAWPELKGVVFLDEVHPFQLPNAGTKAMQAALENPRLTEALVINAVLGRAAGAALVQAVARHAKWSPRREIRAALLRTSHLSLARALEFSREIPAPLLEEVLASSRLPAPIKAQLLRQSQQSP